MRSILLAAAASLTLLTADIAQAQTSSSRQQPVRRTNTAQTWHRTTTRTDNGTRAGWKKGKPKGAGAYHQVTDTVKVHYGGYHRQRPPVKQ